MKKILYPLIFTVTCSFIRAQTFIRSELPTSLTTPWEIIYGPDNYLWLTEAGGKVIRVDPLTGAKQNVYTASDYFDGGNTEQLTLCFQPGIGVGTLGMALHPDFMDPSTSYIYYVYSYNSGTSSNPITKFKIERLKWEASSFSITQHITLVPSMPTGYDHLGGRLMIIPQNEVPYLFFTVGDNGVSETNSPGCYSSQTLNPNNFAQDPNYKNGKIHRFHLDGSIPSDNPIAGNSFYTRGHRNPQGLMFNPDKNIIYDIEHGDRTDDEINVAKLNEEINLLYVAVTRTKNLIHIPETLLPKNATSSAQIQILRVHPEEEERKATQSAMKSKSKNQKETIGFPKKKSYTVDGAQDKNKDAYKPWTQPLDQELAKMYLEGISLGDMAKHFDRTRGAIGSRIKKLELEYINR